MNAFLQEAVALVKDDLIANRISVKADLQDGLAQISGDRDQLQQVFVKLIVNAVESMTSNSGRVSSPWNHGP